MFAREDREDVRGGLFQVVFGLDFREGDFVWEEFEGVDVAFPVRQRHVALYTSVMFHGGADVPALLPMVGPTSTTFVQAASSAQ